MSEERVTWDYEFTAWPHEHGWEPAVYDLFRMMLTRMIETFTEEEFAAFRDSLDRSGITLREVTRVPHHDPEIVR